VKTIILKNLILSAALSMFVASCAAPKKGVADAAVDAATKNASPVTKAAVRKATGHGTGPVERAKDEAADKLGL